jgi:glutathione S-transferase
MADGTLWIGNKRYSSWSLRGWLAVHLAGLDVEERVIPFVRDGNGGTPGIKAVSPNGLVPYLRHDGAEIFESLAIVEYCAEVKPTLWPEDRAARALARSWAGEMHAGFANLRKAMPMNLGRDFAGLRRTPEALADIARIEAIWAECRRRNQGPYLAGEAMGALDCMFVPVATRFITYAPEISADTLAYCDAVRAHPLVARWYAEAAAEPKEWLLAHYEDIA